MNQKLENLPEAVDTLLSDMDLTQDQKQGLEEKAQARHRHNYWWKWSLIPGTAFVVCFVVLIAYILNPSAGQFTAYAEENLMEGIVKNQVQPEALPNDFVSATADFSVSLLQNSMEKGKNSLVSPVSVGLALGMTANGAQGDTLGEMEKMLGGGMSISRLNGYYFTLMDKLQGVTQGKAEIANSIWYRRDDRLQVNRDFLQANADYYSAAAYQMDFDDPGTVERINAWVKDNTDGKIDRMVDRISEDSQLFLLNAVLFEAQWARQYGYSFDFDFNAPGQTVTVKAMTSDETFIRGKNATGFIKPYADKNFSFVAVLPDQGTILDDYIAGLTGKEFLTMVNSREAVSCSATMPKFSYDFEANLVEPLRRMGMKTAFDSQKADFKQMAVYENRNIYVGDVLHKSFIQVDETGTKAGAATKVEMVKETALMNQETVVLNRPFLYAIIENGTGIPLFLGTVTDPSQSE